MRVYKYGLLPPTTNSDLVHDQIKLAHRYRNKLIELERKRRDAHREVVDNVKEVQAAFSVAKDLVEKAEVLKKAVAQQNAQNRSKTKTSSALKREYATVKKERKDVLTILYKARNKVRKECKDELDKINARHNEAVREARASCKVYWGTYLVVEAAMKASAIDLPLWDELLPNNPKFRRFNGEGRVSVQIQKDAVDKKNGMAVANVFSSTDTRIQVAPVPEAAWYSPSRSERRKKSRTVLKMRIGSEGRDPIWATWPMIMHRPLPENSRIKIVTVNCRKIGPRVEWTVDFFVDDKETLLEQYEVSGAIGLDVGWRLMDDGSLRVAFWEDDEGEKGEFRLSPSLLGSFKKVDELKSIRDKNRDAALIQLAAHFKTTPMPTWMRKFIGKKEDNVPTNAQACAYLLKWKSIAKLTKLVKQWKEEGVKKKDEKFYKELEAWRYHDFHLWAWQTSQHKKATRRRKNDYKVLASELSKRYHTLVLEKFDLRRLVKLKNAEDSGYDNETARNNRFLASIHELRNVLINAFQKCGEVEFVKAANTTRICSWCGALNTFDAARNLKHQCYECGIVWDQDDNASTNIRRRKQG